ncbi:fungal protein [Schizosaccharomyces cryophilus OY26]|uniref:Fungal protein n=1 Tax=Schizosaccharomyces cryophilus (strain OY26 / ATCC MYA-4695 / CBS 11777 / NBRC 106824 / NRRL Y48691) TaxID=653667 RepID=S9XDQ0_SCHCR|nr:uncharacterized protein SPOG_00308 [Schizosaccharomyces cryophilus OY26]EPY51886.1 fungal protein [Schizosaccharomyces cryophilus OY26]
MSYNDIEKLIYFNNHFLSELPEPHAVFNNSLCFENFKTSNTLPFENPSDCYSLHTAWDNNAEFHAEAGGIENSRDASGPLQDVKEYLKDDLHDGSEAENGRTSSKLLNHNTIEENHSETSMDRALQSNNSIYNILSITPSNSKIAIESQVGNRPHFSDFPTAKENRCLLLTAPSEKPVSDSNESCPITMKQRNACTRHYLPYTPIHPMFPSFYSQLPKLSLFPLPKYPLEEDVKYIKSCPIDDYYLPRYTRGQGKKKEGLCPICCFQKKIVWLRTKTSAFWYHMNFLHGIHSKGRPYHPPIEFRTIPVRKVKSIVGLPDRRQIVQGKCHQCKRWIRCQGRKDVKVKVPEIFWWKHAHKCHSVDPNNLT